jgi:hypothetical protein
VAHVLLMVILKGGTLGNCFVSIRWDSLNDADLNWTDDTKIVVI